MPRTPTATKKHKLPPLKLGTYEQKLALLTAMRVNESSDSFKLLIRRLDQMIDNYRRYASREQPSPKWAGQLLSCTRKWVRLADQTSAEFFSVDIPKTELRSRLPDINEFVLEDYISFDDYCYHTGGSVLENMKSFEQRLETWCEVVNAEYRKRDLRKLLVEPFLRLMSECEIVTNRRSLPLAPIFDRLFDYLGITPRLSKDAIAKIANEMAGATTKQS